MMKAMILAAGRGERMRPLTDHCPKPLLRVGGQALIEWHIQALAAAGFEHIVINHAYLGHMIQERIGYGERWGIQIDYSPEAKALESAGGIAQALPLLTNHAGTEEPFLVLNGDVFTDWNVAQAFAMAQQIKASGALAWLVLVNNPEHHREGDFALTQKGFVVDKSLLAAQYAWIKDDDEARFSCLSGATPRIGTFSGIGVYHPQLFDGLVAGQAAKLAPILRQAMGSQQVLGGWHSGVWVDVGTPERLEQLNRLF